MDIYGIGQTIQVATDMYFKSVRGTGRTKHMMGQIRNGDCIIFEKADECRRVKGICEKKEIKVTCLCAPAEVFRKIPEYVQGFKIKRLYFDHAWLESFYRQAIENAQKNLNKIKEQTNIIISEARGEK